MRPLKYAVDIYRGAGRIPYESWSLEEIVLESLERFVGRRLDKCRIVLQLQNTAAESHMAELPVIENLDAEFGYAYVIVMLGERVVYQHPHPVDEIIAPVLRRRLMERCPEEGYWTFHLRVPEIDLQRRRASRPAPVVSGSHSYVTDCGVEHPFTIRRLPEPPLPQSSLDDFGVTPREKDLAARVKILVPASIERSLTEVRPLSSQWEEGGFLVGRVFQETKSPGESWLVQLTDAPNAEYTGASLIAFTFTSDSFAAVKRQLDRRPGERIVGWFHTHLFPATDTFGLSSIDYQLHFTTFTIPWQVAGLINLDGCDRTLRFFFRHDREMRSCPVWRIDG